MPAGTQASRSAGGGHPGSKLLRNLSRTPNAVVALGVGAISAALFLVGWSYSATEDLDNMKMAQDLVQSRFSDHCSVPTDGAEGESGDSSTLQTAIVMFAHGESSPPIGWPGELPGTVIWDCSPQDLPRYWRLNKKVDFEVRSHEGKTLQRSFTPNGVARYDEKGPAGVRYSCGPSQLTGNGFKQMVALGRRLAEAYGENRGLLGEGLDLVKNIHVQSVDSKNCLASAVGVMMSLLTTPQSIAMLKEGSHIPIYVDPSDDEEAVLLTLAAAKHIEEAKKLNASKDDDDPRKKLEILETGMVPDALFKDPYPEAPTGQYKDALRDLANGEHVLSRWCHKLPFPCWKTKLSDRLREMEEFKKKAGTEKLFPQNTGGGGSGHGGTEDTHIDGLPKEMVHPMMGGSLSGVIEHEANAPPERCLTTDQAFRLVRLGEAMICKILLDVPAEPKAPLLAEAWYLLNHTVAPLGLISTDSLGLTVTLRGLLGRQICEDALLTRPPYGSRLAMERWKDAEGVLWWRILYNGYDISHLVEGCKDKRKSGCPDNVIMPILRKAADDLRDAQEYEDDPPESEESLSDEQEPFVHHEGSTAGDQDDPEEPENEEQP